MDEQKGTTPQNPKDQLAAKLKDANNVLVTVSTSPSVDQLAAAIGLTLFLSKLGKHATTVFSGDIPSAIDFLKPEETIEDSTDSLRDFIISLDKAKADKIRYKVEDTMVKIFITPYRTSISDKDLVFGQGDFNVDVVVGLGIHQREDIDQAIMAHGRILHDATVATINTAEGSELGTLNWTDPKASSLCEMAVLLVELLKADSLDSQMATAFLTGVVAETERFSNEKTSSTTMNASAKLMAAGANQQLVATKLQQPVDEIDSKETSAQALGEADEQPEDISVDSDGSLHIEHESTIPEPGEETENIDVEETKPPLPPNQDEAAGFDLPVPVDEPSLVISDGPDHHLLDSPTEEPADMFAPLATTKTPRVDEPTLPQVPFSAPPEDPVADMGGAPVPTPPLPILTHDSGPAAATTTPLEPTPVEPEPDTEPVSELEPPQTHQPFVDYGDKTLNDIEETVDSPHAKPPKEEVKLPGSFAKTLDNKTLNDIEETVDSPHQATASDDVHKVATEQIAKAMSDKTLDEIEEKTGSPHVFDQQIAAVTEETAKKSDAAKVLPPADSSQNEDQKEGSGLEYEAIDSEPPEVDDTKEQVDEEVPDESDVPPKNDAADAAETTEEVTADNPEESKLDEVPSEPSESEEPLPDLKPKKADEARDAISSAIKEGGDGTDSLPILESVGVLPSDDSGEESQSTPSVHIDDHGNLSFPQTLLPNSDKMPHDQTAAPNDDASPPPVPPPMLPPAA